MPLQTHPIVPLPLPKNPDPNHPIPLRLEITDLTNQGLSSIPVQLFIQALDAFMKMDNLDDQLSYFRVAAIHGVPYVGWDGVRAPSQHPDGGNFCVHNQVTFATWHRPYLLLFERCLYNHMGDIINKLPETERLAWELERERWRLPYWNWGVKQAYIKKYGLPQLATLRFVKPNQPNPMWNFTNPVKDSQGDPIPMGGSDMREYALTDDSVPWSACKGTSRYVNPIKTNPRFISGENNFDAANIAFNNRTWSSTPKPAHTPMGDLVARLLSYNFETYGAFVSTKYHLKDKVAGSNFLSLELIHNNVHVFSGGYESGSTGHMADIAVAAFDPIFWLHHSFVDYLHSAWQTLHWGKWFDNPRSDDPTPTDPLSPFHKNSQGDSYTSNDVRDWTSLNYQYSGLPSPQSILADGIAVDSRNARKTITDFKRSINQMYGHGRRELLASPDIQGNDKDYIINFVFDKYTLPKSYLVHFFLGPVPYDLDPGRYVGHENHVGFVATFSRTASSQKHCQNCKDQKSHKVLSKAQIPITLHLLKRVRDGKNQDLPSLLPHHVENYLIPNLSWKVVYADGEEVPIEHLPSLKVLVMQGIAEHSEDETQLSKYYGYVPMWAPTKDKNGGAHPERDNDMWVEQGRY